ncbi:unnamed protein product [Caenorhabditis nigoni]
MDANLRINMSQRISSIRAVEKAVPLKMRYLSIWDTTVKINSVCYNLSVHRSYPNEDIPHGVENDFDRFGFEIPIGSSPILPGDVSVRNRNERVSRTDTDELEEYFQTKLTRCENILQTIAEVEKTGAMKEWDEQLQSEAEDYREKLKPFHCRRYNLSRPFNCYIQFSTMKYGEDTLLQRLAYTRKLYEAVKHLSHILFANRPVIKVKVLECRATHAYRIPVGLKISANELRATQSQIGSIAKILEGDVNTLRVFEWENAEIWWQHSLVQNAKEFIAEDAPLLEQSALMLRIFRNKIIRFKSYRKLTAGQYCELIESWMSAKREVGSELFIRFLLENERNVFLQTIETRTEVISREERCLRIRGEHGTQIELCAVGTIIHPWAVKVKIIEN